MLTMRPVAEIVAPPASSRIARARFANPAETLVRRNKTDSSFRCFSVTLIARSLLMGTSLFQILYHYVAEFSLFPYLGEGVLRTRPDTFLQSYLRQRYPEFKIAG